MAAQWTKTIELGPMVSPMTFRMPGVLAKMAASVDALAGGRLILGVGAGWNENEHTIFGGQPSFPGPWESQDPRAPRRRAGSRSRAGVVLA